MYTNVGGRQMIQIFFREGRATSFVALSDEVYIRFRLHMERHGLNAQQIVDNVRTAHGSVSEATIVQYMSSRST